MEEHIKGEELKKRLIKEIDNLSSINEMLEGSIARSKSSDYYKNKKEELDKLIKKLKDSITLNQELIVIMKNQLKNEFNYDYDVDK